MKRFIPESELILNEDGSIFHLHLRPEHLADKVIMVGDPSRVEMIATFFDNIECRISNREFLTITGTFQGKRITAISHGIGTDNIDIVLTELDALVNVDLSTRKEKEQLTKLSIVRVGTSGGMQHEVPVGTYCIAEYSIGFDGVLNFYAGRDEVSELDFEESLKRHLDWNKYWASPYVVKNSPELIAQLEGTEMVRGITISANGFYGPQGREVRLPLADPMLNSKIESFRFGENRKITNYEMESSALAGLSLLMGHNAMTVCYIIANRISTSVNNNYKDGMKKLIKLVLERL